jgi:hypothetical protein
MVSQPPAPGESAAVGDSKSLRPILGQITTESSESGQRIDWFVSRSGEALWMTIAVSGDFDSASTKELRPLDLHAGKARHGKVVL